MNFIVKRSSDFDEIVPPCDGAIQSVGTGGCLEWILEVNTLEELLRLADNEGILVLHPLVNGIEIYDYERE